MHCIQLCKHKTSMVICRASTADAVDNDDIWDDIVTEDTSNNIRKQTSRKNASGTLL